MGRGRHLALIADTSTAGKGRARSGLAAGKPVQRSAHAPPPTGQGRRVICRSAVEVHLRPRLQHKPSSSSSAKPSIGICIAARSALGVVALPSRRTDDVYERQRGLTTAVSPRCASMDQRRTRDDDAPNECRRADSSYRAGEKMSNVRPTFRVANTPLLDVWSGPLTCVPATVAATCRRTLVASPN